LLWADFFSDKAYFEGDPGRGSTKNATQDEEKYAITKSKDDF
jgi:hypothetical protein